MRAGDAVFVPAGTAHTIGPGVVLCEIQQHSDITYRVFDYNRVGPDGKPRALHIRQALDVMHFGEQSGGRCDPVRITHGAVTETFFRRLPPLRHGTLGISRAHCRRDFAGTFRPADFSRGHAAASSLPDGAEPYAPAEVWLLPAALGAYQLVPESPLPRCCAPMCPI